MPSYYVNIITLSYMGFCLGEGQAAVFEEGCQEIIRKACMVTEGHFKDVKSGVIRVSDLQYIDQHLDTFADIIAVVMKHEHVKKEVVEKTVKMRLREVEEFSHQQGLINMFANLCQLTQGTS